MLNLVYYLAVELIPSALVLFILRKLPPKVSVGPLLRSVTCHNVYKRGVPTLRLVM